MTERLGVVGGTFDPIHLGHVALAEAALECGHLDRVLLIPAARPPHRGPAEATAEDRFNMTRLAVAGLEHIEVSDLELRRAGPSYTLDTLVELQRRYPEAELFLVLGWDAARELRQWNEPERVIASARLIVVNRPGLPAPSPDDLRTAGLDPATVLLCSADTPDINATRVRQVLAAGGDLDGLLNPDVARYLDERGLYRGDHRE